MHRMRFENRRAAGEALASAVMEALGPVPAPDALVLAIPRGGLVVAAPLARRLGALLVPVFVRKLGVPWQPEAAFGAVDADGEVALDRETVELAMISQPRIELIAREVQQEIERRRREYAAPDAGRLIPERVAVIVDDGLATGYTMLAAARYVRRRRPRTLIVAVPCASTNAAELLAPEVDRLVAPIVTDDFQAVGEFYDDFSQITDAEVSALLREINRPPRS